MKKILFLLMFALPILGIGQNDLESQTFRGTRVVNGHSVETNDKGEMTFVISHRFGYVSEGAYQMFGLDQANMRLGLEYGITNRLMAGWGRSSFQKTIDGFVKYQILQQGKNENTTPLSITGLATIAMNGLKYEYPERENYLSSRFSYAFQLMFARKFSDSFTWQIMPTMIHRNFVPTAAVKHDVFAIGSATRWQVTKTLSLQTEYYYTLPNQLAEGKKNALSVGFDIETKGHMFQLHVSNSFGMIENYFVSETKGDWLKGDIGVGFNITRDFRVRGRK